MFEVGLVHFARLALEVGEAVLPDYRTKFSKHTFTQPQLMAILCLMRYEDWTLRKAEVRLAEHGELRNALGLRKAPDHTTLYRFMRRLDEQTLLDALNETVRRMPASSHTRRESPAIAAVDATGLASGAISTFYVRRTRNRGGEPMLWRRWLKWLIVVDTKRQIVLAHEACSGPYNGSAMLRPLADAAHRVTPLGVVLADAEFDSEQNHRYVREQLKASSVILAKRGKPTWQVQGYRAQMRVAFHLRLVPAAGIGRERLLGGKAQALCTSTGPKPRNTASAGTAARAGLQPISAKAVPGYWGAQGPYRRRILTEPDGF